MRGFRILTRSVSESFKSVGRNLSLSIASISCIAITLVLVGISIIISYNVNNLTNQIEEDVTVVVFLNETITTGEIESIKGQIKNLDNVESVKFKSNEETRLEMQKDSEDLRTVLEDYTSQTNPLLNSFLVKVKDINNISNTANEIKAFNKVEVVKYGEGKVEQLVKIFEATKKATYIVVGVLIFVTAFLISNTIKITITNRKREIEIMRLVGASNTYIKLPFFFEGLTLGFIGSIPPLFVCCYGYAYIFNKFNGQVLSSIINLVKPSLIISNLILYIVLVGVLVGAFGSYRAVRRYLKI